MATLAHFLRTRISAHCTTPSGGSFYRLILCNKPFTTAKNIGDDLRTNQLCFGQELTHISTIAKLCIRTFHRKIGQFLEMGIQNDLLLVATTNSESPTSSTAKVCSEELLFSLVGEKERLRYHLHFDEISD